MDIQVTSMNPRTDPSCQRLLTELRVLARTVREASQRSDRESGAVGRLWGIRRHLDAALDAAEREIAEQHPDECSHEWHYYGTVNGEPDYGCQLCGATRAAR